MLDEVARDDQKVDARSIMGLMMLAAGPGSVIVISAQGPEAAAVLSRLGAPLPDAPHASAQWSTRTNSATQFYWLGWLLSGLLLPSFQGLAQRS